MHSQLPASNILKIMEQLYRLDLVDFRQRYMQGLASDQEIDSIMSIMAAALKELGPSAYRPDPDPGEDDLVWWVVECLTTLRYANDTSHNDLIASFLHGQSSLAAATALNTLCIFYELTAEYVHETAELIRGVPWDDSNHAHDEAITMASLYLKEHEQPVLLRALIETYENTVPSGEPDSWERLVTQNRKDSAYAVIEHIMGVHYAPGEVEKFRFKPGTDSYDIPEKPHITQAARERLAREESAAKT